MNSSPDYQYYNITVPFNSNNADIAPNQQSCRYNVELSQPILPKASDYYMSIIRFSVPLSSIPILVPQVKKYQVNSTTVLNGNVDLLDYMVAMYDVAGSLYYRNDLTYIPQNNANTPLSPAQNNGQQQITSYYFVYSYQWFLDILNRSMSTAWSNLASAKPAVGVNPPFFILDSSTQLLSLICPYTMVTQQIRLLINFPLLNLLQGFKTQVINVPPVFVDQTQDLFEIGITDSNATNINYQKLAYAMPGSTISTPPLYIQIQQEFVALQLWSPFYDIAFFSQTMPVNNEVLQANLQDVVTNNPNYLPILTDFNPLLDTGLRTIAQYYNSGPYRMLDLTSNEPLRKISLQIYWLNKYNQLFPLVMSNGQYFTVKLMFVKKSAYKSMSVEDKN